MNARLTGTLVAMAALLAAGLSTGTRVYYLLFGVLLIMLLMGAASAVWTLWTVRVEMKGAKPRVTRGDTLMAVFTVCHSCVLPVAAIRLTVSVPSACAPTQEISVHTPPFASRTFRCPLSCPHRGIYEAGVTRISVRDMFGLFTLRRRPGAKLFRVEVLPRVPRMEEMELKTVDMGPECLSRSSEDTASPSDVRAWQDGDSLKKVHWKLSMRRREIMVRTYEESARPDTLILPDLSEATALRDQQLTTEDGILENCLGAVKAQLDAGYPVRMPLTAAHPSEVAGQSSADLPAFLDAALRVSFDSPFPYEKVLMQMMPRMQRTGGVVLATSRLTPRAADLVLRMQQGGVQVRLYYVSDDVREETQEMLERLRMSGSAVLIANR